MFRTSILTSVFFGFLILFSGYATRGLRPQKSLQSIGRQASLKPGVAAVPERNKQRAAAAYGKLPLSFESNQGQTDSEVKFLSRGSGYTLFLTRRGDAVLGLSKAVVRMNLAGAKSTPQAEGLNELEGKSNYFIGNDPKKWRTNVPNYARARYREVYRGIDIVYYGNQRQLEYDFVVAPGADPKSITLDFEGVETLNVNAEGDLVLHTEGGDLRLQRPLVYQEEGGDRRVIPGRYSFKGKQQKVGFQVGPHDHGKPLVIDPAVGYSTFLGGSSQDSANGIAVDADGNAYVTGRTLSTDFPTTFGAFQTTNHGFSDSFVAKLNPLGTGLVYSTFLGGSSDDYGNGIAVDALGNAYITGYTISADFPITLGAFQTAFNGPARFGNASDAFVTKLNALGTSLLYSTYLGGSVNDSGNGIAVDAAGSAYVTGFTFSDDFPTTPGAFQTTNQFEEDAFVTKLNPLGTGVLYSTYLGGDQGAIGLECISVFPHGLFCSPANILVNVGQGIAVDATGNAYVTGQTSATDFPTTAGSFQTGFQGGSPNRFGGPSLDAFVTKLNALGTGLLYSTYLGGSSNDNGNGIAVDAAGSAYVTGQTGSTDFPTTLGAFQTTNQGGYDAFVTKLNALGTGLLYSTYLGGIGGESGNGIAVDAGGNAYLTGQTGSTNFPTMPFEFRGNEVPNDAFVTKLNALGTGLLYSTFLGGSGGESGNGIVVDAVGSAYVTGFTESDDFPTTLGAFQTTFSRIEDAFVTKFQTAIPTTLVFTPASATTSDFDDAAVVQARLTFTITRSFTLPGVLNTASSPLPGRTITFKLGSGSGTATCSAVTDITGTATCSLTPNQAAGTYTLSATFAGDSIFAATSASMPFTLSREETVTKFSASSPTLLANGSSSTFSATLKEDGVTPISGRTLTFMLGSGSSAQSCSGTTDASGAASCSIVVNQPLGPNTITVMFAGDAFYQLSSDTRAVLIFAFMSGAGGGSFVIGNLNAVPGSSVTWWDAQWSKDNSLGSGSAPATFKGFANMTSPAPPACGGTWTSNPANSSNPPAAVPAFMAVMASSSIGQSGSAISGNIAEIVIVSTNPGYAPNPGHAGTGTVVAVLCGP